MHDSEKRSKTRLAVTLEILVRDRLSGLILGKLANIHEEGFMVIGSGDMREDALYQVRLEAPEMEVHAGAECLWISETGTGDKLWAGFTFLDINEEDQDKLLQLVKYFEPY